MGMRRWVLGGLLLALAGCGEAVTARGGQRLPQPVDVGLDRAFRAGAPAAAPMADWRARMDADHAASMARLRAQAAAGQAAHRARQEAHEVMNRNWASRQAAGERETGRFIDAMREGTTVEGGGVRVFVPHGSTAYTDGAGAVAVVPEGGEGPVGWREMTPVYAAPD